MLSVTAKIIKCKYFHSVWLNSRVCFEFHTSRPVLVRRMLFDERRKSTLNVEPDTGLIRESGPIDFFGIESDVGVIHVNKKKPPCSEKARDVNSSNSSSNKERLLSTSFGNLRFDSDNQPDFHGQYENVMEETVFSYGQNAQMEKMVDVRMRTSGKEGGVSKLQKFYAAASNKSQVEESSAVLAETELPRSEISLVKNKDGMFEKSDVHCTDSHGRMNAKPSEVIHEYNDTLGVIDRAYFGDGTNDSVANHVSTTETDYRDDFSLGQDSAVCSGYSYHEIHKGEVKEGQSLELSENLNINQLTCDKKNSYIDYLYFRGLCATEDSNSSDHSNGLQPKEMASFVPEKQIQVEHYSDSAPDQQTQRNVSTDSNFIDSSYFGNHIVEASPPFHLENCRATFQNKIIYEDEHSVYKNTEPGSVLTNLVSEKTVQSKRVDNNFVKSNQEIEENLSFSPLKQSHLLNAAENERDSSQDSSKETSEFQRLILTAESKLELLEATVNASEDMPHSNEGKLETAYNYVLKLRNNEVKPDVQPGAELDSERLRILRNQVPDLSHLTRSELLDLLKDHVLFSNDDIVILNKPYNLIIHESQTTKQPCLSSVLDDFACRLDTSSVHPQLHTVHRLDKETTGCLLLARNELTAQRLKSLFAQRKIGKTYLIVTTRVPDPREGIIDIPIAEGKIGNKVRMVLQPDIPDGIKYKAHVKNGKRALTYYKVVSTSENAAVVEVKPETGIKHQIRVHLGFGLNCPVLGDHKYSHLTKLAPQRLPGDILRKLKIRQSKVRHIPMHIHARTVIIPKFLGDEDLIISAPLPEHIRDTLKRLKCK